MRMWELGPINTAHAAAWENDPLLQAVKHRAIMKSGNSTPR